MRLKASVILVVSAVLFGACSAATPTPAASAPAASVPAAASPASGAPAATTGAVSGTLTIWDNYGPSDKSHYGPLQAILSAYQAANPGVKVQEQGTYTDTELPTKVETAFLAGQEPDLVFQNASQQTFAWAGKGITVPVSSYLQQWGLQSSFVPAALSIWTSGNQAQAFPLEGFFRGLFWNKTILDKAGVSVPTTTDELLAAIPKIKAAGYQVIAAPGGDGNGRALFQLLGQTFMTDKQMEQIYGTGGFTSNPVAMNGASLFIQLRDAGLFAPDSAGLTEATANQEFVSGKAAAVFDGSWDIGAVPPEMQNNIVLAGFPLPAGSPWTKPIAYTGFEGKGIWITKNGENNLPVIESFIKFFYQPSNIALFADNGMLSPIQGVQVDPSKASPLSVQQTNLQNVQSVETWGLVLPAPVWGPMLNVTKQAYATNMSVSQFETALDQAFKQ